MSVGDILDPSTWGHRRGCRGYFQGIRRLKREIAALDREYRALDAEFARLNEAGKGPTLAAQQRTLASNAQLKKDKYELLRLYCEALRATGCKKCIKGADT